MKGFDTNSCYTPLVKRVVQGAQNIQFYSVKIDESRKVMTLQLLRLIGHEIAKSDWSVNSKQVIFTAAVVAFFGSFRLGEILSKKEWVYNEHETLTWSDVITTGIDSILIHLKMDKSRNPKGAYVDLFSFSGKNCCPIQCIMRLKEQSIRAVETNKPVFSFLSGKLLTVESFIKCIQNLLRPHIGNNANHILGHSFRAGIPSAMAEFPDLINDKEIQSQGRWCSDSFTLYTRLQLNKKRAIFKKITKIFR
jgi:hypothetical protein